MNQEKIKYNKKTNMPDLWSGAFYTIHYKTNMPDQRSGAL
jgi:hypothetical protein